MNFMNISLTVSSVVLIVIGSPALSAEYTNVKPNLATIEKKMNIPRVGNQSAKETERGLSPSEFSRIPEVKKFKLNNSQNENVPHRAVEGNSNGGGGNSLGGKLIESYIKDPMFEIPAYSNVVEPMFELLATKSPCLTKVYQTNINKLTWYFIPSRLKELSESVTGIPFLSDQIAVPKMSTNEVWIDSDLFESLDSDLERGKLIIHEAVLKSASVYSNLDIAVPPAIATSLARKTTALLFSNQFQEMTPEQFALRYRSLGWSDSDETLINPNCKTK